MRKTGILFCSLLIISQFAIAQKGTKLTYGSIKDSVYANSFFGLTINLPHGWSIQSKEQNEQLQERGKDLLSSDENTEAIIDASLQKSAIILNISKYELGAPVDFNPTFIVVIENLDVFPGIKTGKDYLFHSKKFMEKHSKINYIIDPDFEPVTVGGKQFYRMNTIIENGSSSIRQQYYATISKKFAVAFIATQDDAGNEAELEELIRNNIKFSE